MGEFIFINRMPSIGKGSTFNCCSQLQNQIPLLISLTKVYLTTWKTRALKQNFWAFNAEVAARQRAGAAPPSNRDIFAARPRNSRGAPFVLSIFFFCL